MLYFSIQNASPRWDEEGLRGGGCEMTISCPDYPRMVVESSLYWRKHAIQGFSAEILNSEFRARRSIRWGLRLTLVAPRIVNDVSCETRINHETHFAWQAQCLVKLEGDACCSAHCTWRFICEELLSWAWLCVAGAVFGAVGGWLLLLRAL